MSETKAPHFWLIMRYACDRCGLRMDFYLEDGCEGPRDRQVVLPPQWAKVRADSPVRDRLPMTVPQTASGRYVLPVPFIAAPCPVCQPRKPGTLSGGVLQHIDWNDEPRVDTTEPPTSAGRFLYPRDWWNLNACGEAVLPALPSPAPTPTKHSYSIHAEPGASAAVKRLVTALGSRRYEDDFTPDELRTYRDGLSAVGVLVVEIETWTETKREAVL